MEGAGGWSQSRNIFEGKHKHQYINLSQILECYKLYLYLKIFGDDKLHVFFECFYPFRIMQLLLFLHERLSFASLSAVPHVSSIIF